MTDKLFKAKVFKVEILTVSESGQSRFTGETEFNVAATNAHSLPFADRCKLVKGKYRRLEQLRPEDGCILLNFVSSEFTGPGRFSPTMAVTPIKLSQDEFFSYETAMLYDLRTGLAFLESASVGIGPESIADYIGQFVDDMTKYRLIPRLDEEASARARRHRTIKSLKLRAHIGPVAKSDREAGYGTIQAFGGGLEGETITLQVRACSH